MGYSIRTVLVSHPASRQKGSQLTLLVPLTGSDAEPIMFIRNCPFLDAYIEFLWDRPEFPSSYTAPEQHHIWTTPKGQKDLDQMCLND